MGRVLAVLLVVTLVAVLVYGFAKSFGEAFKWLSPPRQPRRPWELD